MANTHKYYLAIDEEIVDFSLWPEFQGMEDFLTLSLFTQMFTGKKELIGALEKLGFSKIYSANPSLSIVKKTKDEYTFVTSDLLFKSSAVFLSYNEIVDFLYTNRHHTHAIRDLFLKYLEENEQLANTFKNKVEELESCLKSTTGKGKDQLLKDIASRKNSLKNFNMSCATILNILQCLESLKSKNDLWDESAKEYFWMLQRFVTYETSYIKGSKITPNYRGLVKLAVLVEKIAHEYGLSQKTVYGDAFRAKKIKILTSYKKALSNAPHPAAMDQSYEREEFTNDPDEYMFLERWDFERMITPSTKEDFIDVIAVDIEGLEEKKMRFSRL